MAPTADATALAFTPAELGALGALRRRFAVTCDRFSDREHARLLFLRWLCRGDSSPAADRETHGPLPKEVAA